MKEAGNFLLESGATQTAERPSGRAVDLMSEPREGQVLDGRFTILETINRGGMAWIYKAFDAESGKVVAIKLPLARFECDTSFYSRFQREETIGLTLNHPSVVKILPAGVKKSRPYIVMEYLEGVTLAARLRETPGRSEAEAARIAIRVCDALNYLHRNGVIHRDLKPENIMLCDDGSLRILDFGIAKSEQSRRLTFGGFSSAVGTPDYIAPEQVKGKRGDGRTDIYSLGAMLYVMTTGSAPFEGDSPYVVMNARVSGDPEAPRKRNPQLSPQMEEIILHAMEREPSDRFASAAAMKAELSDYSEVSLEGRYQRLTPPRFLPTHVPLLKKMLAIVAAQVALFFILYWHFNSQHHNASSVKSTVTQQTK